MNLRKNKGYVGVDDSIAVLVLLIIIPTVTGMVYNMNKTNSSVKRKTEAINIAVNTLEVSKGMDVLQLSDNTAILDNVNKIYNNKLENLQEITSSQNHKETATFIKDDITYMITIEVEDYKPQNEGASDENKIVKTVTAHVKYKVGDKEKSIDLSTSIGDIK